MKQEDISEKQGISMIIFFIMGTSTIYIGGLEAKQDIWLSVILTIICTVIIGLIYIRLHILYPKNNLLDICEICFGKFIGKIFCILFTWYVFYSGAIALEDVILFIRTTTLINIPMILPTISMGILLVYLNKKGIKQIGMFSKFFIVPIVIIIIIFMLLLVVDMDINRLKPFLTNKKAVLEGVFSLFTFPFGEILAIPMILSNFSSSKSCFKIYTLGIILGGIILLCVYVAEVLVIGIDQASVVYYPSYNTAEKINISGFIHGLEIAAATIIVFTGFVNLSIFLSATCKGVAKIVDIKDYRVLVVPIALMFINISYYEFNGSVIEYFEWGSEIWPYYVIPFQIFLPIIILIGAEIKNKKTT